MKIISAWFQLRRVDAQSEVVGNANAGSYQNYQNGAVSNQLTSDDTGRGGGGGVVESGMERTVNLLMSDRYDALYSGGHKEMSFTLADQ
jgi:hypothetical protein